MQITPELIEEAKKLFPVAAFVHCEEVIAQHVLYNQFAEHYPNWPKVIFYIVADEVFGPASYKDQRGDLGRKIKFDICLVPENLKPKNEEDDDTDPEMDPVGWECCGCMLGPFAHPGTCPVCENPLEPYG